MRRRVFITLLGSAAAAWPLAARAQQASKVPRMGFLGAISASGYVSQVEALRAGLRELGYVEGKNIVIEFRWAEGKYDRLPELAAELASLKVDVLVTHGTPGTIAAKRATTTIPIVAAALGDPVATGIVTGLVQTAGNITGVAIFSPELSAKRLEVIKEAFPHLRRVAILLNPQNPLVVPILPAMELAAASLAVELQQFAVRGPNEFEAAFSSMANKRVEAVVVLDDGMLIANAGSIANMTSKHRLSSIGFTEFAQRGGLMAYGVNFLDMFRRAATLIDKIVKGANPADLPIEQATKFETIVNLKTAKTLGIDLPTSLLLRADRVIE
jgi:putative ABC transport system substrate-binding protein